MGRLGEAHSYGEQAGGGEGGCVCEKGYLGLGPEAGGEEVCDAGCRAWGKGEKDFGQAKKMDLIGTVCTLGGRFEKVGGNLVTWLENRAGRLKTWLFFPEIPVYP